MRLLILRLLGWKRFTYKSVSIFQREALVDQTIISQAIDDTVSVRAWCPAKALTIIVEDRDFSGLYNRKVRSEVVRFSGGWFARKSATVRLSHSLVNHTRLVELLREVGRVDKG